jgi:hypothetical protein
MYCNSSKDWNNMENRGRNQAIEPYLSTKMIKHIKFLSLLKVVCLSITNYSEVDSEVHEELKTSSRKIISIKAISSFGNHATIVCKLGGLPPVPGVVDSSIDMEGANSGGGKRNKTKAMTGGAPSPIGRIFVELEGEPLNDTGVNTLVYQQAVGTTQPVFPTSVDECKRMFVMGDIDFHDLLHMEWGAFADSIMRTLNDRGINAGRNQIQARLTVLFDKLRTLDDSDPKTKEIRAKYCMIALDLLRDDLIQGFGSTIQKGVLATINIYNDSDKYDIHHGKRVTDPNITKAVFNALFLVNVVFDNGVVYTVHMEIDRAKVKSKIDEANLSGRRSYQSVSYWVDDVIKFIHENKDGFYRIVKDSIQNSIKNSVNVSLKINSKFVTPTNIQDYLKYLHFSMNNISTTPPLHHAAFVFGCKCFTVYDDSGIEFCQSEHDGQSQHGQFLPIITTLPNNDMVVGFSDTAAAHFVSIKPIFVRKRLDETTQYKITDVNFVVNPYFHCPTYPTDRLSRIYQVLGLNKGDTLDTIGIVSSPDSSSLKIQEEVIQDAEDQEAKVAQFQASVAAGAEAIRKADEAMTAMTAMMDRTAAEAAMAEEASDDAAKAEQIINHIKNVITTTPISPPASIDAPAAATALVTSISTHGSGIVKQALSSICGTFHYLLSPLIKRTAVRGPQVATGHQVMVTDEERVPQGATDHLAMVTDEERAGMTQQPNTDFFDDNIAINISVVLGYVLNYIKNMENISIVEKHHIKNTHDEIEKTRFEYRKNTQPDIAQSGTSTSTRGRDVSPDRDSIKPNQSDSILEVLVREIKNHEENIQSYKELNRNIIHDVSEIILYGDGIIERYAEIIRQRERMGGKRRTLRRAVKKNTRRSYRSRRLCRRQYSMSKLKNKNTQRRGRSRKSKTIRR